MIKNTLALLVASVLLAPIANASDFSCYRDDDGDDWVISGVLGAQQINLFDNDADSAFRLKMVLESYPPIYVYEEIKDLDTTISIRANPQNTTAKATYEDKSGTKLLFTCKFD